MKTWKIGTVDDDQEQGVVIFRDQTMVVPFMAAPHRFIKKINPNLKVKHFKSVINRLITLCYNHNNMWLTRLSNYFCQGPLRSVLIFWKLLDQFKTNLGVNQTVTVNPVLNQYQIPTGVEIANLIWSNLNKTILWLNILFLLL